MKTAADYHRVHQQLARERGPASAHRCSCGAPACDWAYDKSDPDEVTATAYNGSTVRFSLDIQRYAPMCKPCHHAVDHPPKTHCKRGHELTVENSYIRASGGRLCKTCRVIVQQAWRAKYPDWRQGRRS